MAASLQQFLDRGQLGPLTLGMSPSDVQFLLGDPDARSKKLNPLLLRYGPLELTFLAGKSQPPCLVQLALSVSPESGDLPDPVAVKEWAIDGDTTMQAFDGMLRQHNIQPLTTASTHEILLPSGVRAIFVQNRLKQLRISRRDTDDNRPPYVSDDRDASPDAIRAQLADARVAIQSGLLAAALLLTWAALEAAMRRAATHAGIRGNIGVQPTVLIRELFAAGRLSYDDVSVLEGARQLRASVAHGVPAMPISLSLVEALESITTRILDETEEHKSLGRLPKAAG